MNTTHQFQTIRARNHRDEIKNMKTHDLENYFYELGDQIDGNTDPEKTQELCVFFHQVYIELAQRNLFYLDETTN